jgi:serine palmitoyltransferase
MTVIQRICRYSGRILETINLGSYNYLGFAQNQGPCVDAVIEAIQKYGVAVGSQRPHLGTIDLHLEVEKKVSEFVGKEAALVVGMGFATNSAIIPGLVGPVTTALEGH